MKGDSIKTRIETDQSGSVPFPSIGYERRFHQNKDWNKVLVWYKGFPLNSMKGDSIKTRIETSKCPCRKVLNNKYERRFHQNKDWNYMFEIVPHFRKPVWKEIPSKQGLKLDITLLYIRSICCMKGDSIKTRIETIILSYIKSYIICMKGDSIKTRIETLNTLLIHLQ